jgi:hypothetical protein
MELGIETESYHAGFKDGFRKHTSDWISAYHSLYYTGSFEAFELECKPQYDLGYNRGYLKRTALEAALRQELGPPTLGEHQILSNYLYQLADIFYNTSLLNSWDDRLQQELMPRLDKGTTLNDLRCEIIRASGAKRAQDCLKMLKTMSLIEKQPFLYYQTLRVDSALQLLRFSKKGKQVDTEEYQHKLIAIENSVAKLVHLGIK